MKTFSSKACVARHLNCSIKMLGRCGIGIENSLKICTDERLMFGSMLLRYPRPL